MKKRTRIAIGFSIVIGFLFLTLLSMNIHITAAAAGMIVKPENARPAEAILLLGARVYADGRVSAVVGDRIRTAVDLYRSGRAKKILVSGDHGAKSYDEVTTIERKLTAAGVPEADIFLDHAGFNTYDSLYRAAAVFKAGSLIVVTQRFHLSRALFLADRFGISAQGVIADRQRYRDESFNELREFFARAAAWCNALVFRPRPRFLGPAIDLSGDGRVTRD
jgi:SanA protein